MARNKNVSPEVAEQLAEAVRHVRKLVFSTEGIPVWGTQFAKIESEGMAVGMEFARLFLEHAVDEQAGQVPAEALDTGRGIAQARGAIRSGQSNCTAAASGAT